jgi:hypothetical protein
MKRTLLALAVAGLAVIAAPGSAVAASGNQSFRTLTVGNNPQTNTRTVVAFGVINAAGTEQVNPGDNGVVTAVWTFPSGKLFVTQNLNINFLGEPVPPACIVTATITGTWTITGGTGAYAGASGSGTLTGTGRVFAKYDPVSRSCIQEGQPNLFLNQRSFRGTVNVPNLQGAAA